MEQAQEQLTNFTELWTKTTKNGTLPYSRSGFFGWTIPFAYAVLRETDGLATAWDATFTATFKRALHSFMAPSTQGDTPGCNPNGPHPNVTYGCGGGDGYWEIGNWNKVRALSLPPPPPPPFPVPHHECRAPSSNEFHDGHGRGRKNPWLGSVVIFVTSHTSIST